MPRPAESDRSNQSERDQASTSAGAVGSLSRASGLVVVALLWAGACSDGEPAPVPADPEHERAALEWREERHERLDSDYGWLSLVGLHWLEEGETRFGGDPENAIVINGEGIAPYAGVFERTGERVLLHAALEGGLTIDGEPMAGPRELASDASGSPDDVFLGRIRLRLLDRNGRLGIRVRDPEGPARTGFEGLEYFEYDESLRVAADWVTFDEERFIAVPNVLGTVSREPAAGRAEFAIGGERVSLYGTAASEGTVFFIFADATNGETTYGAGRFLYAAPPEDGRIVIDFNRAYSPPCAFTPFATCPLPPKENKLAVRVEAGERAFGKHG